MFIPSSELSEASQEVMDLLPSGIKEQAINMYSHNGVFKLQVDSLVVNMSLNILMAKNVETTLSEFENLVKSGLPDFFGDPFFREITDVILLNAEDDIDDLTVDEDVFIQRIESLNRITSSPH